MVAKSFIPAAKCHAGIFQRGLTGCETKICKQLKKRIKPQFVSPGNELPMASRAGGTVRSERGFGESQPRIVRHCMNGSV